MSVFDNIISSTRSAGLQELRKTVPRLDRTPVGVGVSLGPNATPIAQKLTSAPDEFYRVIIQQQPRKDGMPGRRVVGTLPESLNINTTSEWNTPFADSFLGEGKLKALAQVFGVFPNVQSMTAQFWSGSTPIELSIPLVLKAHDGPNDILKDLLALKSMCTPTKDAKLFLRAPGPLIEFNYDKVGPAYAEAKDAAAAVGQLIGSGFDFLKGSVIGSENGSKAADSGLAAARQAIEKIGSALTNIEKEGVFSISGRISVTLGTFFALDDVILRSVDETIDTVLGPNGRPLKTTVNLNFITRVTPTFEDIVKMHLTGPDVLKLSEFASKD